MNLISSQAERCEWSLPTPHTYIDIQRKKAIRELDKDTEDEPFLMTLASILFCSKKLKSY